MMHYKDQGNGPVVVLVHGYCESLEIWDDLAASLAHQYRVITLDLPGFGKSELIDPKPTIEFYAHAVCALLDELSITKCVFMGHSLGGYVALAFADLFPNYLNGLGLIHSTALADSHDKKANRTRTIEFLSQHGMKAFSPTFVPLLFANHRKKELSSTIIKLTEIVNRTPVEGACLAAQAMRDRPDRTHTLQQLAVPLLMVIGQEDKAVSLQDSQAQLTLAPLTTASILKSVGHMAMYEEPALCAKIIQGFLVSCDH